MENVPNNHFTDVSELQDWISVKNLALEEKMPRNMKILPITRILEAMLRSANVILGSVLAVKKWDIGICPKVMYRMYLGLIQMWRKEGLGISPNVLYR